MREVAEEHRLADPVRAHQDDVLALGDEAEREEVLDLRTVDPFRPRPVEVAEWLECPDAREMSAVDEAPSRPLLAFDRNVSRYPVLTLGAGSG